LHFGWRIRLLRPKTHDHEVVTPRAVTVRRAAPIAALAQGSPAHLHRPRRMMIPIEPPRHLIPKEFLRATSGSPGRTARDARVVPVRPSEKIPFFCPVADTA
jgi:hypothetical protein